MKLLALIFTLGLTLPAFAKTQPVEPDGGSKRCNHRPTLPGCPYWCKFHPEDVRCKAAR